MVAWIKVAFRNLIKNRRRTIITSIAIAVGFAALNLFGGFAEYMNASIRFVTIYAASQGHLMVFREGFLEKGRLDPARYMLTSKEVQTIREVCMANMEVELATPQLNITGLLTNGEESTIFIAQGIIPSDRHVFLDRLRALLMSKIRSGTVHLEGQLMADDQIQGVAVSRGLAAILRLKIGDWAVAFSNTVDGQMNAIDVEVFQLFNVSSAQLNDKFMIVPFRFAQKLLDTEGADRVVVLLFRTERTHVVRDYLSRIFEERGLDFEIKTWDEMSGWYRKVKNMFDMIFKFLFTIVAAIVVMSMINTMSMSVLERTREIGTLRVLGLKQRGVMSLFAIEGGLLGCFGSLLGIALTFIGWGIVKWLQPTWMPPGVPRAVIIRIELVPEKIAWSFLLLMVIFLIASMVPARRASRHNIVDALGHV